MNERNISFTALSHQWNDEREELLPILEKVFASGKFVGGEYINVLEKKLADLCGTKFCLLLNSGTDALVCSLIGAGVKAGDEVITPPNSFIASTAAIAHIGATPKFIDVLPDQNMDPAKLKSAITDKTSAIMPVHLTGRVCRMDEILKISVDYSIPIVDDAAQAIGSKYQGKCAGAWGLIAAFSTHPLKNFNACGDGGFVTTNNEGIYKKIKSMRNHGMENRNLVKSFGYVSRMDNLQAAILDFRLDKLSWIIKKRRENVQLYHSLLKSEFVRLETEKDYEYNTYHTFVVHCERRDELQKYLEKKGINTAIHYPIPIHKQLAYTEKFGPSREKYENCERQSEKILSLPIHQYLTENDIKFICNEVLLFYHGKKST